MQKKLTIVADEDQVLFQLRHVDDLQLLTPCKKGDFHPQNSRGRATKRKAHCLGIKLELKAENFYALSHFLVKNSTIVAIKTKQDHALGREMGKTTAISKPQTFFLLLTISQHKLRS